jgi:GNAT superfamily N-acetyltransferase
VGPGGVVRDAPTPSSGVRDSAAPATGTDETVALVRDSPNWLSVIRNLQPTDVILLLTPIVDPIDQNEENISDPFEYFGRALLARHSRIRHSPYTNPNGITSTHVGYIKRSKVVILVVNDATVDGHTPQIDAAHVTRVVADNTPVVIVLTKDSPALLQLTEDFPTVIRSRDYSESALERTASLIFGEIEGADSRSVSPMVIYVTPRVWQIEQQDDTRYIPAASELWNNTLRKFRLPSNSFAAVVIDKGYARQYIVKDPVSGELLGFCATYHSFVDRIEEKLIASLTILLVHPAYRHRGIGLSLHNHAIEQMQRIRGVTRLQLGSTFPRTLYGPPLDIPFDNEWFNRRGWITDRPFPGQGQTIYDLILSFSDWHELEIPTQPGITFRPCTPQDMPLVLQLAEEETTREDAMGWIGQYFRLWNDDVNLKDAVVAMEGNALVGIALTYSPSCGSPVSKIIPWAEQIGEDVGGVTCICIKCTCSFFYQQTSYH